MAITNPKEKNEPEYMQAGVGVAILIVVFVLAVWPGFLKIEDEDQATVLPVKTFVSPQIGFELLEGSTLAQLQLFEKVPPISLYCLMDETDGSLTSKEDCDGESDCFWNKYDEKCYRQLDKPNPFLLHLSLFY